MDRIARLYEKFGRKRRIALLRAVVREFKGRIAVVSSFGDGSAALLWMVSKVNKSLPVLFIDTGKHFPETLSYLKILVRQLGLTNVHMISASREEIDLCDPESTLCEIDDNACCDLRKVKPLSRALEHYDAWISGRKRFQKGREDLELFERSNGHIKINPLFDTTQAEIDEIFATNGLERHPLEAVGLTSIGCYPCTGFSPDPSDRRAGRKRRECGIHLPLKPEE